MSFVLFIGTNLHALLLEVVDSKISESLRLYDGVTILFIILHVYSVIT